jgi:hypothetical protein
MAIHFHCTKCRQRLSIAAGKAGSAVRCPICKEALVVDASGQANPASTKVPGTPLPADGGIKAATSPPRPDLKRLFAAYGPQGALVLGTMFLAGFAFLALCVILWNALATPQPAANQHAHVQATSPKAAHPSQTGPGKEASAVSPAATKPQNDPHSKEPSTGLENHDSAGAPATYHERRQPGTAPTKVPEPPKEVDPPVPDKKPAPPTGPEFILPLDVLGPTDKLQKVQVVRLQAKVSFADAQNVNDVTLTWCWEPHITLRVDETFREQDLKQIYALVEEAGASGDEEVLKLYRQVKELPELDPKLARAFNDEVNALLKQRNYRPLFDSVLMMDGSEVFSIFNKRLVLPLKNRQAAQVRNLCFALSLSNLLPLKHAGFTIKTAEDATVQARACRHFTVKDAQGLKLDLYFDKETTLLTKISHPGYKPTPTGISQDQVLWEHFFSNYRESDGIKQWRKLEIRTAGKLYAVIEVVDVEYFQQIPPELHRPNAKTAH